MPRIPDENALGPRLVPNTRRQVSADRSGVILGEAFEQAGNEISGAADVKQRKEDSFRYQQAKSRLLHADLEARKSLQDIDDYDTWVDAYQELMVKGSEEASAMIRSDNDRALFDLESKLDIARGSDVIEQSAIKREVDDGRADLNRILEENRTAVLEAKDTETQQAIIENSKELIASAEDNLYLTAQEAEKTDQDFSRDTAEGFLTLLPPDHRAEMLASPEGTIAEALPPDRRELLKKAALAEDKVTRVRGESQDQADGIMEKFPENRSDALAEVRKIKDPDVRAATVDNVNQRFNEIKTARAEENTENFNEAAEIINGGGYLDDIPPRLMAKLSSTQRNSLKSLREPVQNDAKFYDFMQLPIDQQGTENLMEWRPFVDDGHFNQMVSRQRAILDAQEGGTDQQVALTSALSTQQRIERTLLATGVFERKPSNVDGKRRWAKIEYEIAQQIEAESVAQNRRLKPTEIQTVVDQVALERFFVDEWGRDPERLGVELTEEEKRDAYVPFDDIPQEQRRRLENYANSNGWRPDEEQIGKAYAAARLRMGEGRINDILSGNE